MEICTRCLHQTWDMFWDLVHFLKICTWCLHQTWCMFSEVAPGGCTRPGALFWEYALAVCTRPGAFFKIVSGSCASPGAYAPVLVHMYAPGTCAFSLFSPRPLFSCALVSDLYDDVLAAYPSDPQGQICFLKNSGAQDRNSRGPSANS